MTDTRQARAKAWGRIHQLLAGIAEPHQFQVEPGGLMRVPGDRAIAFWFDGEQEKGETLGNVMVIHKIAIRAFWRPASTENERADRELEIWTTCRAIQDALRGDSDLNANVTDLTFGLAQRGFEEIEIGTGVERVRVMTLDIPLLIQELEAEGIAA